MATSAVFRYGNAASFSPHLQQRANGLSMECAISAGSSGWPTRSMVRPIIRIAGVASRREPIQIGEGGKSLLLLRQCSTRDMRIAGRI